jgi:proteasome lid subunit RPN8/RPN11
MQNLKEFHDPNGPERCGIVMSDGRVIELRNLHPDPMDNFAIQNELLFNLDVVATWHTHPRTGPNLTVADYKAFMAHPRLRHYVVSASEIWCFEMSGDILAVRERLQNGHHDNDNPTRIPPEPSPGTDPG